MPQNFSNSYTKICKICGKEFHPTSTRQMFCNSLIPSFCVICGKPIDNYCNNKPNVLTCSSECQAVYANRIREKRALNLTRKCKYCGKEFHPKSARDVYCYDKHYKTCVICGKQFEIDVRKKQDKNETCSKDCKKLLALEHRNIELEMKHQKETMLRKYGVENIMQVPGIKQRIVDTNLDRYGVEYYTQTDEYKNRIKETSLMRYGTEHHLSSESVKAVRKNTNLDRYGVENVFQSDSVKDKIHETVLDRYGVDYATQSDAVKNKTKETNLSKYGVPYPSMLEENRERAKQTNLDRYGRLAYTQQHIEKIDEWYDFINNPRSFIELHFNGTPRSENIADYFGVHISQIDEYLRKYNAFDCIRRSTSLMEEEVTSFIKSLDCNIKIINNDRTQIKPMELDIYLPDYKFAIECNPTATHNSSASNPWGGESKSRNYHSMKTLKCNEKGIFLFHIFGYEWTHRKDIVLSMIRHILKKDTERIYARNCTVKEIDHDSCKIFLDYNHIQGSTNASIRIGLYHNDDLVSVMTFGKMRGTMGTGNSDLKDCFELSRFCNKINTSVVGGASKLFKYFINKYKISRVRSFSDLSHTSGGIYNILGFKKIHTTAPQYVWVDSDTDCAYNRVNTQKNKLKKFLHDDTIDLSNTEKQIMISHGFIQVFDSGKILWEWNR